MHNFYVNVEDISSPANKLFQHNNLFGKGSEINSQQSESKTCKLKDNVLARGRVVSTTNKRFYNCLVQPGATYVDYNMQNVIYLIT